jgi:ABC-type lipoprotein export system ATPase subunit
MAQAQTRLDVLYKQILAEEVKALTRGSEKFRERFVKKSVELHAGGAGASGFREQAEAPFKILLADEPTGNLDSKNGDAVMALMKELHQGGATLVMVTHDPRFARYADRTIHIFDGRIVEEGAMPENAQIA